jgi:hypothetical protein
MLEVGGGMTIVGEILMIVTLWIIASKLHRIAGHLEYLASIVRKRQPDDPTFFACTKYATWRINGYAMCGTHANAFVWERVLGENGYNAHSDGILIQDGLRPPQGR